MFSRNDNQNEGTFACSPGTKPGTRVHSPKPPFYETALLSPSEKQVGKRSLITFFFVFGTLSVTFRSLFLLLLSLFSALFCQTPFAGLLLQQGERSDCNHKRVFRRKRYSFGESIRLGIEIFNCRCNLQKRIPSNKKVVCNNLMTKVLVVSPLAPSKRCSSEP